jgi:hypothetical protein
MWCHRTCARTRTRGDSLGSEVLALVLSRPQCSLCWNMPSLTVGSLSRRLAVYHSLIATALALHNTLCTWPIPQ